MVLGVAVVQGDQDLVGELVADALDAGRDLFEILKGGAVNEVFGIQLFDRLFARDKDRRLLPVALAMP